MTPIPAHAQRILARLDAAPGLWAILPGEMSPDAMRGTYPTATAAVRALREAGYLPSGQHTSVPDMPPHDPQSVLRYAMGTDRVVVARLTEES